jgi:hypothetical protein
LYNSINPSGRDYKVRDNGTGNQLGTSFRINRGDVAPLRLEDGTHTTRMVKIKKQKSQAAIGDISKRSSSSTWFDERRTAKFGGVTDAEAEIIKVHSSHPLSFGISY